MTTPNTGHTTGRLRRFFADLREAWVTVKVPPAPGLRDYPYRRG